MFVVVKGNMIFIKSFKIFNFLKICKESNNWIFFLFIKFVIGRILLVVFKKVTNIILFLFFIVGCNSVFVD